MGEGLSNWSVLKNPEVEAVVTSVATALADMNQGILEFDDLKQEAMMMVASKRDLRRYVEDGNYGYLYNALKQDLFDAFVRPMSRTGELESRKYKTVSIDDEGNEAEAVLLFDLGNGDYTPEAVQILVPAIWDESYAYGLPAPETAPEQGMPKAASNKARSNSHWAFIADIKDAWANAPLTQKERRALFLFHGVGMTHKDIGVHEGIARPGISKRISTAEQKMCAYLNGGHWSLTED